MPFGNRLKEARLMKGMTQEELAQAIHVTKGAIGNYESEVSSPKETILIKLMEVLDVDANFLFQDLVDIRPASILSKEENELVNAYRAADLSIQAAVRKLLDIPETKENGSTQTAI